MNKQSVVNVTSQRVKRKGKAKKINRKRKGKDRLCEIK